MDHATALLGLAREIASSNAEFHLVRGPGGGNRATNAFMAELRERSQRAFGQDHSEKHFCGDNELAVDFYFPETGTIVEVALGLPNPNTEFEKDILKAIIALERGHSVKTLVLISRAGAIKKCLQPGRSAMVAWARTKHNLEVVIRELPGEPRKRRRFAKRREK